MKRYAKRLTTLLVLGALLASPLAARAAGEVGEQAPDFSLQDRGSASHKLTDYAGQVVLLFMFGHN